MLSEIIRGVKDLQQSATIKDWNNVAEEGKEERERIRKEEERKRKTDEARNSPIGKVIVFIKEEVRRILFVARHLETDFCKTNPEKILEEISVREQDEDNYEGFGYNLKTKIGDASIIISVRKEFEQTGFSTWKRTNWDGDKVIGVKVVTEFSNSHYGKENESKAIYRVKLNGTWNSIKFEKKVREHITAYKEAEERKLQSKISEESKLKDKEKLRKEFQKLLGNEVIGLSETIKDYSIRYPGGGYKEVHTVKKFRTTIVEGKEVAQVTFQLIDQYPIKNLISNVTISEVRLTNDQFKQLIDLLKSFK